MISQEAIDALNAQQCSRLVHPYTCGNRDAASMALHLDGEGILVATPDGWVCPYCDYRQPLAGFSLLSSSSHAPSDSPSDV